MKPVGALHWILATAVYHFFASRICNRHKKIILPNLGPSHSRCICPLSLLLAYPEKQGCNWTRWKISDAEKCSFDVLPKHLWFFSASLRRKVSEKLVSSLSMVISIFTHEGNVIMLCPFRLANWILNLLKTFEVENPQKVGIMIWMIDSKPTIVPLGNSNQFN